MFKNQFKSMNGDLHRKLCDYLCAGGIYIPKNKNTHIDKALSHVVQKDLE